MLPLEGDRVEGPERAEARVVDEQTCTRQMPAGGLGMDTASDAEVPVALEATSCPFGP